MTTTDCVRRSAIDIPIVAYQRRVQSGRLVESTRTVLGEPVSPSVTTRSKKALLLERQCTLDNHRVLCIIIIRIICNARSFGSRGEGKNLFSRGRPVVKSLACLNT